MLLDDILAANRQGKVELDPFTYSVNFITLAASVATPGNIPINADSDFVIRYSMISVFQPIGTPIASPDLLITIFDTGSGRNLQDQAQHVTNVMGTAQRPYIWPEPKLVAGSSVLTVTLTNNTAGTFARVDVALGGFKVFYLKGYKRGGL
jgi:hypothetical protein